VTRVEALGPRHLFRSGPILQLSARDPSRRAGLWDARSR
jgi:hypothetical protein